MHVKCTCMLHMNYLEHIQLCYVCFNNRGGRGYIFFTMNISQNVN